MINLAISEKLSLGDNSEAIGRIAYLAGLVDGEGSIVAHHSHVAQKRKTMPGVHMSPRFQLTLEVRMCSGNTTGWIQQHFGGKVHVRHPKESDSWKVAQHHWRIYNDHAIEVLKLIYPYLITKKRQAALAFKFREVCKQGAWSRDSYRRALLIALTKEISALNNFGFATEAVETVREAGETPVMIQSGLHGDMQRSAGTPTA